MLKKSKTIDKDRIFTTSLSSAYPVNITREHCYVVLKNKCSLFCYDNDIDKSSLDKRSRLSNMFAVKHTDEFYYIITSHMNKRKINNKYGF
jgi:hypothetical protein